MRISEVIAAVRHRVNDGKGTYHPEPDIVRWINLEQRALFRRLCGADESYGAQHLDIAADDKRFVSQVSRDIWRYYMPTWAFRIERVSKLDGSDPNGTPVHGDLWRWSGNRTVDVKIGTAAATLRFFVSKVPAKVRPITVSANSTTNDELLVPIEADEGYEVDREEGCMLGATLEVVTIADAARDSRGQVVVCTAQERTSVDGTEMWKLSVAPPFPDMPSEDDTVEMHTEIADVHAEYLIDLVAEALLQRQGNIIGIQLLRQRMEKDELEFINAIRPRDTGKPKFREESDPDDPTLGTDPDRDPFWARSGL